MCNRLLVAVASLFSFSSPATAQDLQPTTKWTPHFSEKQCLIRRTFGTADKPVNIYLKRPIIGDTIQLSVVRPGYAMKPERLPAKVTIDGRMLPPTSAIVTSVRSDKVRWHIMNLALDDLGNPGQTVRIGVETEGVSESFSVPGFALILGMLDECVRKMRTTWNVDASGSPVNVQKPAVADIRGVFTADDYPLFAAYYQQQGSVSVTYLVAETGKVVDCMITRSTGTPALEEQTCGIIINRADFTAAVGMDGKPAKAAKRQNVTWKIE